MDIVFYFRLAIHYISQNDAMACHMQYSFWFELGKSLVIEGQVLLLDMSLALFRPMTFRQ